MLTSELSNDDKMADSFVMEQLSKGHDNVLVECPRPSSIYQSERTQKHNMSIKNATQAYKLPQIYKHKKEYLIDDSIDVFKFLEYICLENVSVAISESRGTGKTFFMLLMKYLPDYQFLRVFKSPSFTSKDYPQHLSKRGSESKNKQHKLDSKVTITKQNIFDLYSKTIIMFIDLRKIVKKANGKNIDNSFLECFVVLTINAKIIKFIKNNTKINQEQTDKLNSFDESNLEYETEIEKEKIKLKSKLLKKLKKLYKKITEYIHSEITTGKLERNLKDILNSLNEEKKRTDLSVNKFIIMIDEINILQSRIDYSANKTFTAIVNNVIINMLAYKRSTNKEKKLPTSIQYVFSSVLPLCQISNNMEYPVLEDFATFNRNKVRSFGEFTINHLFKLMPTSFDNLKASKLNLEKIIYELKTNNLDIIPFLERELPDSELVILNKKWNTCVKDARNTLKMPEKPDEIIGIRLIVVSLVYFLRILYKQPNYSISREKRFTLNYLTYLYNLKSKEDSILLDVGNESNGDDTVENNSDEDPSNETLNENTEKDGENQQVSIFKDTINSDSKFKLKIEARSIRINNLKLNTRRILSFLMAEHVEGSLYVGRSFHNSSEMEIEDFWKIYELLKKDKNKDFLTFPLSTQHHNFLKLFEKNVENVIGNQFKFLWVMYNLGYICVDRYEYISADDSSNRIRKVVVIEWTNQHKELAFENEVSEYELTLSFQKLSVDDHLTKIEGLLNEEFLERIITKVEKQIEQTQRKVFFKHKKANENNTAYKKRIADNIPEKIHELQFEAEFDLLFNKYIKMAIKNKLGELSESDINRKFYTKRQYDMYRFEELNDGAKIGKLQKPDIYGALRLHKQMGRAKKSEDKSVYFCFELKRGVPKFNGFDIFYSSTKDYTQIESLKNKNVFYVAASIMEPKSDEGKPLQMTDIGFGMPNISILMRYDDDKETLKEITRKDK